MNNINIDKTQITEKIRVSSAAVFYNEMFGNFYQYETWVFSDDASQPSKQIIHGTYHEPNDELLTKTKTNILAMDNCSLRVFIVGRDGKIRA